MCTWRLAVRDLGGGDRSSEASAHFYKRATTLPRVNGHTLGHKNTPPVAAGGVLDFEFYPSATHTFAV